MDLYQIEIVISLPVIRWDSKISREMKWNGGNDEIRPSGYGVRYGKGFPGC